MALYRENYKRIDLAEGNMVRDTIAPLIGEGDNSANRFGIEVFRNGVEENLTGSTCAGYFIRANGDTVIISGGTVTGNKAYVTLPQSCYVYEGRFTLAIKLTGGGVTGTMRIIDGCVANTTTSAIVDPGHVIPDIDELLAQIEKLENATTDAVRVVGSMENSSINHLYTTPVTGHFVDFVDGVVKVNSDWAYYPEFRVEPGQYYAAKYSGAHVAFFNAEHEYISGVLVNHTSTTEDFVAPAGAAYATYSYNMNNGDDQFFIRSTDYKQEYVDPVLRRLDHNISADLLNLSGVVVTGKNLFNRNNIINGYSIYYENADRLWRHNDYCFCPDFIPVKPSTTYYHNQMCVVGIYDADRKCIQTLNYTTIATKTGTFTTSASAKFIKVGTLKEVKDLLQIEEGSAGTGYEEFRYKFKYTSGSEPSPGGIGYIHTVKQSGGDYSTISAAVAAASVGDIILVYPGTYQESIKTYNKEIHIIGMDRDTTILTYHGRDYSNPPLEIARGSVENLTIRTTNTGTVGAHNAYCVHIDNDAEANGGLTFRNVRFENPVHQGVGIGLRAHFTLTFDQCIFITDDQAALYCHDWETSSSADKTGQKLVVRNCALINNSATHATIMLQSQELATDVAEALFIGNSVLNQNSNGENISMTLWSGRTLTNNSYLGSSDWVRSPSSALNTEKKMNSITGGSEEDYIVEPSTEGTAGQVLTTNGAGGRSWQTVPGGGAQIDDTTTSTTKVWSSKKVNDTKISKLVKSTQVVNIDTIEEELVYINNHNSSGTKPPTLDNGFVLTFVRESGVTALQFYFAMGENTLLFFRVRRMGIWLPWYEMEYHVPTN